MKNANTSLIDASTLHAQLDDASLVIVDTRFNLMDVTWGRKAYLEGHVPGAQYAHLDDDLSGPPLTDRGRHPMPSPEALESLFSRLGIGAGSRVVAYDQAGGAIAARLWWMLRYVGHDAVAVLDGGFKAWSGAGYETRGGDEHRDPAQFRAETRHHWLVTVDQVPGVARLVDSREGARYRGEKEPLDPVAGHIPGAIHHCFQDNLDEDGRFLDPAALRERLGRALGDTPAAEAAFYCGSGVTACHNLLALRVAGFEDGRLYAGSWSEWCADPQRPVATGGEPGSLTSS